MTGFRKLKLEELNRISPEEYQKAEKIPVIVVLDNIRSLHNIGSVFRTADAFRIKEIWLSGYTAQPPHREIQKTALGATETVEWKYFKNAELAIEELNNQKVIILPIEQSENSTSLENIDLNPYQHLALIFGNEVDGVSEEYMNAASEVIEIPQEGTKHSLNISVSAGIILWEIFKVFRTPNSEFQTPNSEL